MGDDRRKRRPGWKAVLAFFVSCAVVYGLALKVLGDSPVAAAVGGLVWAALFVPMFLWASRRTNEKSSAKRGLGQPGDDEPTVQVQVHILLPPAEVIETVRSVANAMHRAKVVSATNTEVRIRVGASFQSWGEHLRVEVTRESDGARVRVTSRPVLRTTLFDYGKGKENVRQITDALQARAASR